MLEHKDRLWGVVKTEHVKPGKGPAFVRTKLKNVESNKTVDKTFNAGTKVETATVDRRTMQYLYNDGTNYVFMDVQSYDQLEVDPDIVGDSATGRTKPATVETGHEIQVPLFVEQGEKVKVDTRDSSYLGRVKA